MVDLETKSASDVAVNDILEILRASDKHVKLSEKKAEKLLQNISESELIDVIGMDQLPLLVYLCRLKNHGDMQLIPIENDIMLRTGEYNLANMSYLAVTIHFAKIDDGGLLLEGNTSYPETLDGCFRFGVEINGAFREIPLEDVGLDLSIGGKTYEKKAFFSVKIPLEEKLVIRFFNVVDDFYCRYGKINSMRFAPVADLIPHQYAWLHDYLLEIDKDVILCRKADSAEMEQRELAYQEGLRQYDPENAQWAIDLRNRYREMRHGQKKPIWLFMDRYNKADDNAAGLFRYVQRLNEIDSYFIIDETSPDYERMKKIGQVIKLYSPEHYLYVLLADYMISSQSNGVVENPFWERAELVRDLYHNPKLIFLQHGYTKDDMSQTLNRLNTNFTGLIASGEEEYRSFLQPVYHYTEKEIWLTGMPRLDTLQNKSEKIILIMPSWRKNIMHQAWDVETNNMLWVPNDDIEESVYCRNYVKLLTDRHLRDICRKYGYRMVFYAHPLVAQAVHRMLENLDVEFWDETVSYQEAFSRAALMITDYSSVAFDFAYMKKPVLYFQFDEKEFFATHTYQKGYFDYRRDGFGEVCKTEPKLVRRLIDYMKNGMNVKPQFEKNMEKAYIYHDGENCRRIVERLKN